MRKRILIAAVVLLAAAGRLAAQMVHARIDGYVQDEEGRFLSGVEVTATNVVSNAETKVQSDRGNGGFRFLGLAPGTYQVSCDLEGYESYVASGIRLSAGQSTTLRVKLKRLPGTEAPADADEPLEDAAGPWKKWQVELAIGGLSQDPDDLNLFGAHDQWLTKEPYLLYMRDPRFVAIPPYGLGLGIGVLHTVTNRWPLTLRLRLRLNRTFSLAAGLTGPTSSGTPAILSAPASMFRGPAPVSMSKPTSAATGWVSGRSSPTWGGRPPCRSTPS